MRACVSMTLPNRIGIPTVPDITHISSKTVGMNRRNKKNISMPSSKSASVCVCIQVSIVCLPRPHHRPWYSHLTASLDSHLSLPTCPPAHNHQYVPTVIVTNDNKILCLYSLLHASGVYIFNIRFYF